jgi:hypothetical protein
MNTPTHAILSYTLLRKMVKEKYDAAWILFGSILPDLAIFFLPIYGISAGYSMREIWDTLYFTDHWQLIIDSFNSVPVVLVVMSIAYLARWRGGMLLGFSMLIHVLGDIFLHNDDAHRHFFPLSDYRLISEVSYWDPAHHGHWGALIEVVIISIAILFLWPHIKTRRWKIALFAYAALCIAASLFFFWGQV